MDLLTLNKLPGIGEEVYRLDVPTRVMCNGAFADALGTPGNQQKPQDWGKHKKARHLYEF